MSQQKFTGKKHSPGACRLTAAWRAFCWSVKVPVGHVEALAAQGEILGAFHLLQQRLAAAGIDATALGRPSGPPFVLREHAATSDSAFAPLIAGLGAAADVPSRPAASGAPTAGFAAAAGALARRDRQVFVVTKYQRFRPLVPSKVVSMRRLNQGLRRRTRGEPGICLEEVRPGAFR